MCVVWYNTHFVVATDGMVKNGWKEAIGNAPEGIQTMWFFMTFSEIEYKFHSKILHPLLILFQRGSGGPPPEKDT